MQRHLVVVAIPFQFRIHMKIITWNVNSIRSRFEHLEALLKNEDPDVVLLQELKCEETNLPPQLGDIPYNTAVYGQKTYNGVMILSKQPIEDIQIGITNFPDDQARYVQAFTGGVQVASVYVPNGQALNSEAYYYKLKFLEALYQHLKTIDFLTEDLILGGDFNITPTNADIGIPENWQNEVLCSDYERMAYQCILNLGFSDCVKAIYPEHPPLTWWDYRKGSYEKGDGLRIDHILASPKFADSLKTTKVLESYRKLAKPSDHAPVMAEFV